MCVSVCKTLFFIFFSIRTRPVLVHRWLFRSKYVQFRFRSHNISSLLTDICFVFTGLSKMKNLKKNISDFKRLFVFSRTGYFFPRNYYVFVYGTCLFFLWIFFKLCSDFFSKPFFLNVYTYLRRYVNTFIIFLCGY